MQKTQSAHPAVVFIVVMKSSELTLIPFSSTELTHTAKLFMMGTCDGKLTVAGKHNNIL